MKIFAGLALFLTAPAAHALLWTELDPGRAYAMNLSVKLSPRVTLNTGTRLKLIERTPLDQLRVYLFEFRLENCPGSLMNEKSEIVIVKELYGVELEKGCRVHQYVEFKDAGRESLVRSAR